MTPSTHTRDRFSSSARSYLLAGAALTAILVGGLGGWASATDISGAVIASGSLVVDTNVKKVQHPTGGIVGRLLVREGDRVQADQVLLRLDDTQLRASLSIITNAIDELTARAAREEAERDGLTELVFPPDLVQRAKSDPIVARLIHGEANLFRIRSESRAGQKAQLKERAGQLTKRRAARCVRSLRRNGRRR